MAKLFTTSKTYHLRFKSNQTLNLSSNKINPYFESKFQTIIINCLVIDYPPYAICHIWYTLYSFVKKASEISLFSLQHCRRSQCNINTTQFSRKINDKMLLTLFALMRKYIDWTINDRPYCSINEPIDVKHVKLFVTVPFFLFIKYE